jgi:hypothetical protein
LSHHLISRGKQRPVAARLGNDDSELLVVEDEALEQVSPPLATAPPQRVSAAASCCSPVARRGGRAPLASAPHDEEGRTSCAHRFPVARVPQPQGYVLFYSPHCFWFWMLQALLRDVAIVVCNCSMNVLVMLQTFSRDVAIVFCGCCIYVHAPISVFTFAIVF